MLFVVVIALFAAACVAGAASFAFRAHPALVVALSLAEVSAALAALTTFLAGRHRSVVLAALASSAYVILAVWLLAPSKPLWSAWLVIGIVVAGLVLSRAYLR